MGEGTSFQIEFNKYTIEEDIQFMEDVINELLDEENYELIEWHQKLLEDIFAYQRGEKFTEDQFFMIKFKLLKVRIDKNIKQKKNKLNEDE